MSGHHHHTHHRTDRPTDSRRFGLTILLNIVITGAEAVGGVMSGSLALLSDAGHNLSDVIALILAWAGAKGARKAPTKKSTYGFKRLEVFTALINALSLVVIAGYIIVEAYHRYRDPRVIDVPLMLIIAVIGLAGNILSVWILHRIRNSNINNRAAFLHMFYDAVSSVAVIVGGVIIVFTNWYIVDLILSVIIAVMILWSGYGIIREAVAIFMEAVPAGIDIDKVKHTIANVPGVQDVHHLHIWSISSSRVALSCHVVLKECDRNRYAEIIREIHRHLAREHNIDHATVQPENEHCPEDVLGGNNCEENNQ